MPLCLLPLSLLKVYFDGRVLTVHAVDRDMQMRSTQADPVVGYMYATRSYTVLLVVIYCWRMGAATHQIGSLELSLSVLVDPLHVSRFRERFLSMVIA